MRCEMTSEGLKLQLHKQMLIICFLRYFMHAEDETGMLSVYLLNEEMNFGSDVEDQRACQVASRYLLRIFMEANSYVQSLLL